MASHDPNRRRFMQQSILALLGGGTGAYVASQTEAKPQPAQDNQVPQMPFVTPVPHDERGAPQRMPDMPPMEQFLPEKKGHAQKVRPASKAKRIAMGFIGGAAVGVGTHMALTRDSKAEAERGAVQNDPERVEWERMQEIRRQMDNRYGGHDK